MLGTLGIFLMKINKSWTICKEHWKNFSSNFKKITFLFFWWCIGWLIGFTTLHLVECSIGKYVGCVFAQINQKCSLDVCFYKTWIV